MAAPTPENTDVVSASGAETSVTLMTTSASNSAASSSATSGPLLGYDGVAKCTNLQLHWGADWLITALCAISKCNHMWPVSNIDLAGGGDIYDAISADFTTYDLTLASITTNVKYADAIGNIADNKGTAW